MALDSPLMALFGRSPVKPMQEHIYKAHACVNELLGFFDEALAGDYISAANVRENIIAYEAEADDLKKDIRLHLPNSLFMPVPRSDLLELLAMQDQLANVAKDISGVMLGREMEIPAKIQKLMRKYLEQSVRTSEQAVKVMSELDELFETGFSTHEVNLVNKLLTKLDKRENKADQMEIKIRAQLKSVEDKYSPIDVMFIYKVIDLICDLADVAQKVGSRLQILLAR